MLDLFAIEDVPWEATSPEVGLRNHILGIPGAGQPIKVTSISQMVAGVLGRVLISYGGTGPAGTIQRLFIAGHGSPGHQSVGIGEGSDPTGNKELIGLGNGKLASQATGQLVSLASYFASNAVVTLGGCEAADTPKGDFLLKAISLALGGIDVQGATGKQWSFMGPSGMVKRCTNGVVRNLGSLSSWPGPSPLTGGPVGGGGVAAVGSGIAAVGSR